MVNFIFKMDAIDFDNHMFWLTPDFPKREFEEMNQDFSRVKTNHQVAQFITLLNYFNTFRWKTTTKYDVYVVGYNVEIISLLSDFHPDVSFFIYHEKYRTDEEMDNEDMEINPDVPVLLKDGKISVFRKSLSNDEGFLRRKETKGQIVFISLFHLAGNNEINLDARERKMNIDVIENLDPDSAMIRFRVLEDFEFYKGIIMNVPFIDANSLEARLLITKEGKKERAFYNKNDYFQNMNYHNIERRCRLTYNNVYNNVTYSGVLGIYLSYDYSYVIKTLYLYSQIYRTFIDPEDIRKLTLIIRDRL